MRLPDHITAEQAAGIIGGMSAYGIIEAIPGATTARVSTAGLTALIKARHKAAKERTFSVSDAAYAIRRRIWPSDPTEKKRGLTALKNFPRLYFDLFGPHVLDAAARFPTNTDLGEGLCRHDWSQSRWSLNGECGIAPNDSKAHRILLGEPCGNCKKRYAKQREDMAAGARAEIRRITARTQANEDAAVGRLALRGHISRKGAFAASSATPQGKAPGRSVRLTGEPALRAVLAFAARRAVLAGAASPKPSQARSVGDPNGADFNAALKKKLLKMRTTAEQAGDARRVGELNAQLRRIGS